MTTQNESKIWMAQLPQGSAEIGMIIFFQIRFFNFPSDKKETIVTYCGKIKELHKEGGVLIDGLNTKGMGSGYALRGHKELYVPMIGSYKLGPSQYATIHKRNLINGGTKSTYELVGNTKIAKIIFND